MIVLSSCQSRVYSWLCLNSEVGERTPPIAAIAAGAGIAVSTTHITLSSLVKVGLLRAYRSPMDYWVYELLIPDASYEIRKNSNQERGQVDDYALYRLWGY